RDLRLARLGVNAGDLRELPAHPRAFRQPRLGAQHDLLRTARLGQAVVYRRLQRDLDGVVAQPPAAIVAVELEEHALPVPGDLRLDVRVQVEADHDRHELAPRRVALAGDRLEAVLAAQLVGLDVDVEPPLVAPAQAFDPAVGVEPQPAAAGRRVPPGLDPADTAEQLRPKRLGRKAAQRRAASGVADRSGG